MIVKKMANKSPNKNKSNHISDMLDYINAEILENKEDKILFNGYLNLQNNEHEAVKSEMLSLAQKSKSRNPVDHILISFRREDEVDEVQAQEAVKMFLNDLGYENCQTAFAVHRDTENTHIHMCINRVDPETCLLRSNFFDVEKMHKSIARIGTVFNWSSEEKARYVVVDDEVLRAKYISKEIDVVLSDKARNFEIRQGEKSMQRVAAEKVIPILESSGSWQEIHERLALEGFNYEKKGGGAVLKANIEGEIIETKPSDLARWASLKNMEKRIGVFTDRKVSIVPRQPEPMPGVPQEILNEYREQKVKVKDAREEYYKEFERQKEELRIERKAILEILSREQDWNRKELALAALHKVSTEYHKEQLESLKERFREKLEKGKRINPSVTNFEIWMKEHKPEDVLNVMSSIENASKRIPVNFAENSMLRNPLNNEVLGLSNSANYDLKVEYFNLYNNAVNADRYRVTTRGGPNGKSCIILDKDKETGVSRGYTSVELNKNMEKLVKFEKNGEHLYYTPLSEKKHHFFIDDLTKESLMKMKQDGLRPACVIESSPGNFQAIFTIPKLGTENDKKIVNDIAQGLNIRYGDVCFSGAIHPHRAPGFVNSKEEHVTEEGYPIVRIIEATGDECSKLQEYACYIDSYMDWKKEKHSAQHQSQYTQNGIPLQSSRAEQGGHGYELAIYNAHRDAALRYSGIPDMNADQSRLDAMIAVRLRGTGHTFGQVVRIIETVGELTRGDSHNWPDYAKRTAEYAFSNEGSMVIDKYSKYIKQWRMIEDKATNKTTIKAILSEENQNQKAVTPEVALNSKSLQEKYTKKQNKQSM